MENKIINLDYKITLPMQKLVDEFNHLYNRMNFKISLVPGSELQILECSMLLNNSADVQLLTQLVNKLKATGIYFDIMANHESQWCYVYRNPNFPQLIQDVWKVNPKITAAQLLKSDICEYAWQYGIRYNQTCCYVSTIMTDDVLVNKETVPNGAIKNYSFCLNIIATDIDPNYDQIVFILKKAENYLY